MLIFNLNKTHNLPNNVVFRCVRFLQFVNIFVIHIFYPTLTQHDVTQGELMKIYTCMYLIVQLQCGNPHIYNVKIASPNEDKFSASSTRQL